LASTSTVVFVSTVESSDIRVCFHFMLTLTFSFILSLVSYRTFSDRFVKRLVVRLATTRVMVVVRIRLFLLRYHFFVSVFFNFFVSLCFFVFRLFQLPHYRPRTNPRQTWFSKLSN
jgi:hypothetical protein